MSHADWLGLLIGCGVAARNNGPFTRCLNSAKVGQTAAIENLDYRTARGHNCSFSSTLANCQWPDANRLIVVGPTDGHVLACLCTRYQSSLLRRAS